MEILLTFRICTHIDLFFFKDDGIRKINVKIKSSTKSSVCTAVVTGRCCEKRDNMMNFQNSGKTGSLVIIFNRDYSTVGGHGEIFERFCATGVLSGYPGEGTMITESSDANFESVKLKLMKFHETYNNLRYDVNHSKFSL